MNDVGILEENNRIAARGQAPCSARALSPPKSKLIVSLNVMLAYTGAAGGGAPAAGGAAAACSATLRCHATQFSGQNALTTGLNAGLPLRIAGDAC